MPINFSSCAVTRGRLKLWRDKSRKIVINCFFFWSHLVHTRHNRQLSHSKSTITELCRQVRTQNERCFNCQPVYSEGRTVTIEFPEKKTRNRLTHNIFTFGNRKYMVFVSFFFYFILNMFSIFIGKILCSFFCLLGNLFRKCLYRCCNGIENQRISV